jgi:hypothetical protein
MLENYNLNPYFDDYNDEKNFHRMLFKPSFAVQARELTQIQTILQKQIERFGNHVFKNGSVVTGGQFFFQDAISLKIDDEYSNSTVNIFNFENKTIFSLDETKRAEVIKVYDTDIGNGDPKTIIVKQIFGEPFTNGEVIKTSEISPYFAKISTTGVFNSSVFSVNEGIFYYEGFFIRNAPQTIAISKYSTSNVFSRIGFNIEESVVTAGSDTSLLDPALESSNYQAPGSDRVKIDLVLSIRSLESVDDEKFIELVRVENTEITKEYKYPIYSVIEDTLARRTYDESGNYTVKPFKITLADNAANSAQTDIILSPGKAYVYGYEFETNSPTILTVDKPRKTEQVINKRLTADYGNFLYTTNHFGSFPINSLNTVDIHCVPRESINTSSTATIANTKIGSLRVNAVEFDSSSNVSDSQTYEYRTYLFDVNVNNSITGNVFVSTSNTQVIIGDTDSLYSGVNDAYKNCKVRIIAGPGQGEPAKIITAYNGTTKTITLNQRFVTTLTTNSVFSIDFEIKNSKSLATYTGNTLVNGANISNKSRINEETFISDTSSIPLIINLGEEYITPGTFSDVTGSYRRLFASQQFSFSESPPLGSDIASANTTPLKNQNYYIVVTNKGTSPYDVGTIIPSNKFTLDTGTSKIVVENGNNMIANIITTIEFSSIGPGQKNKVYYPASNTIQTSSAVDVFSDNMVLVFPLSGQTHIKGSYVSKTPNGIQSLFVSDVNEIVSIKDFNGQTISQANLPSAIDVTSKYIFDDGQRDSFYDHSSIRLRPGVRPPVGPIVVFYNRFLSSGAGYFTVDSYSGIDYGKIPSYTSGSNNIKYNLRDCIDFRPVRRDATTGSGSTVVFDVDSTTTGPKILKNSSQLILDYSHYLPRIDKVVLDKKGVFEVITGIDQIDPPVPKDLDSGMTLYILSYKPYVSTFNDIDVEYKNNKRYTMRDIGGLEKRIENLEYYTSLSLLEQSTLNKQDLNILDGQGLPRFKNGILVDSFKGTSIADVGNVDFSASIDPVKKELRPSFTIESYNLKFDSANSTGFLQSGPLITANAAAVTLIDQPKASKFINVNPFNVVNFLGKIKLDPQSDIWVDTLSKPDLLVNFEGNQDAWEILLNQPKSLIDAGFVIDNAGSGYTFGSTPALTITGGGGFGATANAVVLNGRIVDIRLTNPGGGYTSPPNITIAGNAKISYNPDLFRGAFSIEYGSWGARWTGTESRSFQSGNFLVTDTITATGQTRTGIVSQVVPETITQSIGNRVVDITVIPKMRTTNILFVGTDFKPNRRVYAFFDNVSVKNNVGNRVNKFYLANNNIQLTTNLSDPEFITIRDGNTIVGEGIVAHISNNIVHVTNINPTSSFENSNTTFTITGQKTNLTYQVTGYEHNGGNVTTANATTVTLRLDAVGAKNRTSYVGSEIIITEGKGAGQVRTIIDYNGSTRVATINTAWTEIPDSNSFYGIGDLITDETGSVAGIFTVPNGTFTTGEKLFRLTDASSGDIPSSTTSGDASFFASGLLQTLEETIISTTVPQIQRTTVNDTQVVTNTTSIATRNRWSDPLAQTFLVSPQQYPQGIFLNKIRVCFKSKDSTIPVTLQVRPSVNGYPSSSVVYPFATVSLTPDKVKVTDFPNLDDPTKYTEFIFDAPIYMQPGEHSFVILANSNQYEMYVAEIGKPDLVTGRQISEQPYGGSLFLSQNGSTWTADQNSDMMFRMFRYNFSADPVTAKFLVDFPKTSTTPYDLTHLITADVTVADTALGYQFNSETLTQGYVGYKPITPLSDYDMNDGFGTRVLNPSTGENTFILNADMQTINPDVSPIIDIGRIGFLAVNNRINNLGLSSKDIVVTNGGSGYVNTTTTVAITGGGGFGATAEALVEDGEIKNIYIVDSGSGYTGTPTVTITGVGSSAEAVVIGETDKSGGPALARYITRSVSLNDGFDSGDLRVYLTAYKPKESQIYVYAKFLSTSDSETFKEKKWQLLTPLSNANFVSANKDDYRELVFAPGINGVASNSIEYTTESGVVFDRFKTFAIKIVMASTSSADVPKIRDLRAIAIPEGN